MYIDKQGNVYGGDMAVGDREATPEEVAAWDAKIALQRSEPVDPVTKLKMFLAANPDVEAILK